VPPLCSFCLYFQPTHRSNSNPGWSGFQTRTDDGAAYGHGLLFGGAAESAAHAGDYKDLVHEFRLSDRNLAVFDLEDRTVTNETFSKQASRRRGRSHFSASLALLVRRVTPRNHLSAKELKSPTTQQGEYRMFS
jgi:hypothetical protein